MQHMLLIQYGNGPSPFGSATSREPWKELSTEERKTIGAEYAALSQALKPAEDAKTVRVEDGQIVITDGPSVDPAQARRGYFVVEAGTSRSRPTSPPASPTPDWAAQSRFDRSNLPRPSSVPPRTWEGGSRNR